MRRRSHADTALNLARPPGGAGSRGTSADNLRTQPCSLSAAGTATRIADLTEATSGADACIKEAARPAELAHARELFWQHLEGKDRDESDCHTEYDRKPGITWLSCTAK